MQVEIKAGSGPEIGEKVPLESQKSGYHHLYYSYLNEILQSDWSLQVVQITYTNCKFNLYYL